MSSQSILGPVILHSHPLHSGALEDSIFWRTLRHVRRFSANPPVWIGNVPIADDAVCRSVASAELESDPRVRAFRQIYQHRSANDYVYDLFCIDRWIILLAFMEREGAERCVAIDSDVLGFFDLPGFFAPRIPEDNPALCQLDFEALGMPVPQGSNGIVLSGHTAVLSRTHLEKFLEFVTGIYSDPSKLQAHEAFCGPYQSAGVFGGISDMSLWSDFLANASDLSWKNLCGSDDGWTVDFNVNYPMGFRADENRRIFDFRDGVPGAYHEASERWIQHVTLHMQGAAKQRIGDWSDE